MIHLCILKYFDKTVVQFYNLVFQIKVGTINDLILCIFRLFNFRVK